MNLEDLQPLHRRYRLGVAGAILLTLALLASISASPRSATSAGTPLQSLNGTPGPSPAAGASGGDNSGLPQGLPSPGTGAANGGAGAGALTGGRAGGAGGGPGGGRSGGLTATDQGVTATEIHIAHIRVDPKFYTEFGLTDPKLELAFDAYSRYINDHGGINGRKWVVDSITIADPRVQSNIDNACSQAFADDHDFMYVGTIQYPQLAECAAGFRRGMTDIGFGGLSATSLSELNNLGGRYWIAGAATDRFADEWARYIVHNYGADTNVGLLVHYDPTLQAAGNLMTSALHRAGIQVVSRYNHTADQATAAIQIHQAVTQWKQDNVNLLVPVTNAIVVGIAQKGANGENWRPARGWTFSSIAALDSADTTTFFDPVQMQGAKGIGFSRLPAEPEQALCQQIYAQYEPGATFYQETGNQCHMFFENAAALRNAGSNLTIASWAAGHAQLGRYQGNEFGTQTFGPTKRDGADQVRSMHFDAVNRIFVVDGPFTNNP